MSSEDGGGSPRESARPSRQKMPAYHRRVRWARRMRLIIGVLFAVGLGWRLISGLLGDTPGP